MFVIGLLIAVTVLNKSAHRYNQGYRNTLLLQYNEKAAHLSFYHLQSDKKLREFSLNDSGVRVSNCIDSLIHYVKEQFDGKIVVIDELVSVLKHLLYSPTIKHFEKVKQLFNEMINRADRIIGLDGFMQDWAVKFFKEICPGKQIVTLENTHQGDKPQIYLLEGTIDINERLKVNDKTPWLQKLLQSERHVIFRESLLLCEAIENLLIEQGRTGIRIDSKTVGLKHVKEFLKDPDKWIAENVPEYLIGSPSIESGLDVSIKQYFSEHFVFFFGQLDIDSCIQILGRIRDSEVPKFVWCKKFILSEDIARRPSNVESLQADRARSLMSELNLTIEDAENLSKEQITARIQEIYQSNLDPYTTAADRIKAIRNHEFANYRECLKEQLINNGYPVESITLESLANRKALAKQEREAKDEVKLQNATDIFNASDKYIGQDKINLNFLTTEMAESIETKDQNEVTLDPNMYINNSSKCSPLSHQDSLVNLSPQLDNTNQIQDAPDSCENNPENNPEKSTGVNSQINSLDSEASREYIIEMLQLCDSADTLRQLLEIPEFTPDRLNRAWITLKKDKRRQISIWAKQLKIEQQGGWDFNYLIDQLWF